MNKMSEQSLKDKTLKGVAWSGIDNVISFGMSLVFSALSNTMYSLYNPI